MLYLQVEFVLFAGFYLMRTVQTSSTMSIGLLKKKRLFHKVGILKSLLVVSTLIMILVAVILFLAGS